MQRLCRTRKATKIEHAKSKNSIGRSAKLAVNRVCSKISDQCSTQCNKDAKTMLPKARSVGGRAYSSRQTQIRSDGRGGEMRLTRLVTPTRCELLRTPERGAETGYRHLSHNTSHLQAVAPRGKCVRTLQTGIVEQRPQPSQPTVPATFWHRYAGPNTKTRQHMYFTCRPPPSTPSRAESEPPHTRDRLPSPGPLVLRP